MGISGSGDSWEIARRDIERLEAALAAANHERDLRAEEARLASEGVAHLEQRLQRLRHEAERDLAAAEAAREKELVEAEAAREKGLAEAQARLETREEELARLRGDAAEARRELGAAGERLEAANERLAERERELAVAEGALEAREAELGRLRAAGRERDRKLALAEARAERTEARLEKSQARAEHFKASLVAIREGRSYRLMRVLWRLRHPFRRTSRRAREPSRDSDSEDGAVPPAPAEQTVAAPSAPPVPTPRRRPGERLRVAAILDEMSAACFGPECELVPLALEGWREQLDERPPDLLLVESAWQGNGGEWQYRIAQYPRKDLLGLPALRALVDGCRERGIPTAFWNKEDPVHFDRFAEAASLFDHVFTTDARCVERYRELPGERTVAPLPFAAQPRIHNPAAVVPERSFSPCFAGAWYRDRHPDRRRALEALLDAARPYGLVVYDRRFGVEDDAFGFPERFAPHVLGTLPYERILDVYRSHRVFLNANSVVDSPTMCSRRVFELAACDTAILSTPGAALRELLGEGLVAEAADEKTAADELERLLGDEAERSRRIRAARRAVFARHTYADRLATIAETAGLDASSLRHEPFAPPGSRGATAGSPPGTGAESNGAGANHPWQLLLQPGIMLGAGALADLAAAATFADAGAIGVHAPGDGDVATEHRPVSALDSRALLVRTDLLRERGRPTGPAEQIEATLRQWSADGVQLYAADADLLSAAGDDALADRTKLSSCYASSLGAPSSEPDEIPDSRW